MDDTYSGPYDSAHDVSLGTYGPVSKIEMCKTPRRSPVGRHRNDPVPLLSPKTHEG